MKMKIKILLIAFVLIIFGLFASPAYAGSFFDDFEDGNTDGWWLGYSQHTPWVNGNWRVENGMLLQDQAGDHFNALVEDLQLSSQSIEIEVKLNGPAGYGGVSFWFQDDNNWVNVLIYPAAQEIWVIEKVNGTSNLFRYAYIQGAYQTWHKLKVDADSTVGVLAIYVDNEYLFTHNVNTPLRIGQSGVNNGNSGGYFDNFSLAYPDIIPLDVVIDIRPRNSHNFVAYKSRGVIPVAIFSTDDFNVAQIDRSSLTFGATGDEQSLAFCIRRLMDIDRDGSRDDLMCYFSTRIAGFQCGNDEGKLKGKTMDGVPFLGKDLIQVIPCR